MSLSKNEIIFGSTHRLEVLNAIGFASWGIILVAGSDSPKNAGITLMYSALCSVMRIQVWGTFFICVALIQMMGLFCGVRWIRIHCCGICATSMCMLVYIFGRLDVRGPFITFGSTWAIALWIAMIHDIAAQEISALLRWKPTQHKSSLLMNMVERGTHEQ